MSLSLAFFTFLNAWCISIFLVLPFVDRTRPIPRKKTLLHITLTAFFLTLLLALIIKSGIVPVRNME